MSVLLTIRISTSLVLILIRWNSCHLKKTSTSFENWLPYLAGFLFIIFSNLFSIISLRIFTLGGRALSCNGSRIRSRGIPLNLSQFTKLSKAQPKRGELVRAPLFGWVGFWNFLSNFIFWPLLRICNVVGCRGLFSFQYLLYFNFFSLIISFGSHFRASHLGYQLFPFEHAFSFLSPNLIF